MKILLHICCAPCATYPVGELKKEGHEVQGFWYNPNIHPYQEYCRRRDSLKDYAARANLTVIYQDEYGLEEFIRRVGGSVGDRCPVCYHIRLQRTAKTAGQEEFDAFTTTLLASSHQRHNLIRKSAEQARRENKMEFYYEDFRPGNKEGRRLAKEMKLYRQQYCGCIYSEYERFNLAYRNFNVVAGA